ncbi:hypothetical protein [Cumulibacter manganitolerans]|uniref:hypothetical protein n=1 Tax=Cumulibacter manganitolerans TaxID=1884992 RepID=UPI001294AE89|nr:hypothetical protein [Cumulibacter manganitolerans]
MKVQVLYIEECPNWQEVGALTKHAFETIGIDDVPIEYVAIRTEADAGAVPFAGSPTIVLEGKDLFPPDGHTRALACRVYPTEHGLAGTPTQAQLEEAIRLRISSNPSA